MIHLQNLINSFEGPHFQKNSILIVNFLEIQEKKNCSTKKKSVEIPSEKVILS